MKSMTEQLARKHYERGRQFELQDRHAEAIEGYRSACSLTPSFPEPFQSLGRLLALRGQLTEALGYLNSALDRGDDVQTRQWRGYVLGRLHRYEDALSDYLLLRDLCDPQIEVNIGRMLLALRRFDEAEDVLVVLSDPSAEQLMNAIPRYREFDLIAEDVRSIRYLFGGTCVLGTLGEESLRITDEKYQLFEYAYIAFTVHRFLALAKKQKWSFDAVLGKGVRHEPFARAMAHLLSKPWHREPLDDRTRYLVCSSVLNGVTDAAAATQAVRLKGSPHLHFALGMIPKGDPNAKEPHVIGFVNRCAVPWYRVEAFSRLQPTEERDEQTIPGISVGPAFINPNSSQVVDAIVAAVQSTQLDDSWSSIERWYETHARIRCRQWDFGADDFV